MKFTSDDILSMPKIPRINLINSISGYKSANLIGTQDNGNRANLAIFNSVIHLGTNPPLLGFVLRPTTVERHTYDNIISTRHYTINSIDVDMIDAAHQTSAKYSRQEDEFEITGFNKEYSAAIRAPYVKESKIKIGLELREDQLIKANHTRLVVGEIIELTIPDESWNGEHCDLSAGEIVIINGLDTYLLPKFIKRLPYARP